MYSSSTSAFLYSDQYIRLIRGSVLGCGLEPRARACLSVDTGAGKPKTCTELYIGVLRTVDLSLSRSQLKYF